MKQEKSLYFLKVIIIRTLFISSIIYNLNQKYILFTVFGESLPYDVTFLKNLVTIIWIYSCSGIENTRSFLEVCNA